MRISLGTRGLILAALALAALAIAADSFARPAKPLPALAPAPRDGLSRALEHAQITPAQYALERALSLFHPRQVAARYAGVTRPDPRSATLILRDLSIRLPQLSAAGRETAAALLARPTDNPNPEDPDNSYGPNEATPVCGDFVCIHYVTSTSDQASAPYASQALQVFDDVVWPTEVTTMGYRAPKSDIAAESNGSSSADPTGSKFDVYLANLGDDQLYGYCTSDDPTNPPPYDAWAYCVVDNDYAEAIFSNRTPLENLQITAAHEFFHAVQAAYDWYEDQWIMEATATWIEDEVFDDVNDNLPYLQDGPLHKPGIPLDKGATNADPCCHVYGDWIFFRFLSEWLGDPTLNRLNTTEDTSVVRDIWERLDGSGAGVDNYSMQGVRNALSARGKSFRGAFGKFGWASRISRVIYDEGLDNGYPQAPLSASPMTLRKSAPSRSKSVTLNHQTNKYYEFRRGAGVSSTAKLKFVLDLPSTTTGSFATALVFRASGITPYQFALPRTGNRTFKVPFGSSVTKVDLVLTNGSTRYTCWVSPQSPYACFGAPKDNGRTYKFVARLS